jgi:hypothetical protein
MFYLATEHERKYLETLVRVFLDEAVRLGPGMCPVKQGRIWGQFSAILGKPDGLFFKYFAIVKLAVGLP